MSGKVLKESEKEQESATVPECAVCLQCCIHPAQLPCSHIFCFLCIKGVANQSKRCPLCRHEIPADFTEKPCLLNAEESKRTEEEYHWFYEGRNGWWKYDLRTNLDLEAAFQKGESEFEIMICGDLYIIDFVNLWQFKKTEPFRKRVIKRDFEHVPCWWQYDQRTSLELETAFKQGKRTCELLIAGFLYIADFESMLQLRRNDPSRRRRIKRDLHNVPKKGVAGLRLSNQEDEFITREIRGAESSNSQIPDADADENVAELASSVAQSTDDSTEVTDRLLRQQTHSLHRVLEQMRSLVLGDSSTYNSSSEPNAFASVLEQNSSRI